MARPEDTSVPFRDYIDIRLDELKHAAEVAATTPTEIVPLREHIEAVIHELRRSVDIANDERRRGEDRAEEEREKAARALRSELERSISAGDDALREHIAAQVDQLQAMLEGVRREMTIINEASETAIAKAESLNKERWDAANEWRGQSADRERSQQEQMAALSSTFLPREVADATYKELRQLANTAHSRLDLIQGSDEGTAKTKAGLSASATLVIGVLGLVVAVLSIAVVVILANGAGP